jgi:DNA-binding MarR family transcriptional regulator
VQWDVLRHLGRQPDASLHALAELTFQTDQSMGTLATRMIQRGLIERVPGPGRAVRHRLTARGKEVCRAGAQILDGVLAESLGQLRGDELAELHRLLLLAGGAGQAAAPGPAAPHHDARDAVTA